MMKSQKKYVCYAGYITSQDGNEFYIPATRIAELYNVSQEECYFVDLYKPSSFKGKDFTGLIKLYPRNDGDYRKPAA